MVLQSVFAAIDGGNDDSDHLALSPAQWRLGVHQCLVEMHVIDQRCGMEAVDLHDVIDISAFWVAGAFVGPAAIAPAASASATVSIQATGFFRSGSWAFTAPVQRWRRSAFKSFPGLHHDCCNCMNRQYGRGHPARPYYCTMASFVGNMIKRQSIIKLLCSVRNLGVHDRARR